MEQNSDSRKELRLRKKILALGILSVLVIGIYFFSHSFFGAANDAIEDSLFGAEGHEIVIPAEATTAEPSIYRGANAAAPKKKNTAATAGVNIEDLVPSKLPTWCEWNVEDASSTTGQIILSETNSSWIGIKNISSENINTEDWQIVSSDQNIKIKLAGKVLEAQRSYHVARPDAGDKADLKAWLRLFAKNCLLIAEANNPKDIEENNNGSSSLSTSISQTTISMPFAVPSIPQSTNTSNDPSADIASTSSSTAIASTLASSTMAAASSTATSPTVQPEATSSTIISELDHIVIAFIETGGVGSSTDNDLIKIYNPTAVTLDISGWKLRKRTSSGSEASMRVFPKGSSIYSKGYFTWANSSYATQANVTSTQTLSDDNSVALLDPKDELIDAVGWGKGKDQYKEGNIYPVSIGNGKMLWRRFENDVVKDTDNNALDFEIK